VIPQRYPPTCGDAFIVNLLLVRGEVWQSPRLWRFPRPLLWLLSCPSPPSLPNTANIVKQPYLYNVVSSQCLLDVAARHTQCWRHHHQIKTIRHPIGPLPIVRNLSASNIVSTYKPEVWPTSPSCSSSMVFAVVFHGEATGRLSYEFLLLRRHLSEQLVVVVTQYNDQIHASCFLPIYCTSVFLRASTEHSPS